MIATRRGGRQGGGRGGCDRDARACTGDGGGQQGTASHMGDARDSAELRKPLADCGGWGGGGAGGRRSTGRARRGSLSSWPSLSVVGQRSALACGRLARWLGGLFVLHCLGIAKVSSLAHPRATGFGDGRTAYRRCAPSKLLSTDPHPHHPPLPQPVARIRKQITHTGHLLPRTPRRLCAPGPRWRHA